MLTGQLYHGKLAASDLFFVEADKPVSKIDMENKGPKNSQTLKKKNKLETGGNVFRVCSEVIVKTTWGGGESEHK